MDLDEFEAQYRSAIDDVLNQMQTVVLLLAQAETETVRIGESIQGIRQMMDRFLLEQRQGDTADRALTELSAVKRAERELREVVSRSPSVAFSPLPATELSSSIAN